ncbi:MULTISPECIES: ribulose-phosphate 3-epimerase [Hungatella]|uniref:Ribulose-phosphate 3-epimerase n=1 Tax=Hungatella hathewayi TaxID=154046 RepID=A0A3E4U0L3_9FIRM|nr:MULTISPECIES: ribulose-phosphate 3-epimerase [Hungatella]RGL99128.1 ribulose-phosphate 3-epimerase [Hungatella hathewayi]RHM71403.1 ribulose-phosphate 3-epimerase [Hungatella hathewayi]
MRNRELLINPTIACANLLNLKEDLDILQEEGGKIIHLDIMDGHYVHNLCLSLDLIKAIKENYCFLQDVHLMVTNPQDYIYDLKDIGVDYVCFHYETVPFPQQLLKQISDCGIMGGIALNPDCPVNDIKSVLPYLNYVVVMGVEPGFAGQNFLMSTIKKIKELDQIRIHENYNFLIEADGRINDIWAVECLLNGADMLVSGAFGVFKKEGGRGVRQNYAEFKETVEKAMRIS